MEFLLKGLIIGLTIAAPVGPIGVKYRLARIASSRFTFTKAQI